MTIINPDHEAAIAAFHRAAARAGTGGDGRYARAVAFLEPSVRRELEAAAPRPPAERVREQPCGCVICVCEDEAQCHGCGAKHCGNLTDHPPYVTQPPAEAQAQGGGEVWRPMDTAPRDGTLLRLLVDFDDHPTDDTAGHAPTIGANSFDDTGEDVWQFAGWCWSHDHFTEGKGTPVGWLPMLDTAPPSAPVGAAEDMVLDAIERRESSAPVGWKLVPVEPTPEMRQAYHDVMEAHESATFTTSPDDQWNAMLAAAPALAQQPAARPPKPTECMNGCPDRQVCDHCQWPPGPDQQPAAVDRVLRKVAAIAHSGGLIDMSQHDALSAIRRLTLPYWGKEEKPEQVRAALAAQPGGSDNDR